MDVATEYKVSTFPSCNFRMMLEDVSFSLVRRDDDDDDDPVVEDTTKFKALARSTAGT